MPKGVRVGGMKTPSPVSEIVKLFEQSAHDSGNSTWEETFQKDEGLQPTFSDLLVSDVCLTKTDFMSEDMKDPGISCS